MLIRITFFFHAFVWLLIFIGSTAKAQNNVTVKVNNKDVAVNSVITVKRSDRVIISIPLPAGTGKTPIDSIKAQTCAYANQQPEQHETDKDLNFLERTWKSLTQNKQFGYTQVYSSTQTGKLEIVFDVAQVTECPKRYFWIDLYMTKSAERQLKGISGFKKHYKFMMIK